MSTSKSLLLQSSVLVLFISFSNLSSAHNKSHEEVNSSPPPSQPSVNYKGCFSKVYAFGDSSTDNGNSYLQGNLQSFASGYGGSGGGSGNVDGGSSSSNSLRGPFGGGGGGGGEWSHYKSSHGSGSGDLFGYRLTNGRLIIDCVTQGLGLPTLKPYKSLSKEFSVGGGWGRGGGGGGGGGRGRHLTFHFFPFSLADVNGGGAGGGNSGYTAGGAGGSGNGSVGVGAGVDFGGGGGIGGGGGGSGGYGASGSDSSYGGGGGGGGVGGGGGGGKGEGRRGDGGSGASGGDSSNGSAGGGGSTDVKAGGGGSFNVSIGGDSSTDARAGGGHSSSGGGGASNGDKGVGGYQSANGGASGSGFGGGNSYINSSVNFAIAGATSLSKDYFVGKKVRHSFLWGKMPETYQTQIDWFNSVYAENSRRNGEKACRSDMASTLFWIGGVGSSDYSRLYGSSVKSHFLNKLSVIYVSNIVKTLVSRGAKYIVVQGLPPLGCFPSQLTLSPQSDRDKSGCTAKANSVIIAHNTLLRQKLQYFRHRYPDCIISYADTYGAYQTILGNYKSYHFEEPFKACCGSRGCGGGYDFDVNKMCGSAGSSTCQDSSKYISWDGIHLTDAMNEQLTDLFLHKGYCKPSIQDILKARKCI